MDVFVDDRKGRYGVFVESLRRIVGYRAFPAFVVAVLVLLYFAVTSGTEFSTGPNVVTLCQYIAPVALIAVGEVMLLICGEIDLSAGQTFAFAPFVVLLMSQDGVPVVIALIIGLVVCGLIGLINGVVTVFLGVPSLITTIGTLYTVTGITLIISHAQVAVPAGGRLFVDVLGGGQYSEFLWAVGLTLVLGYILRWSRWGIYTMAVGGNPVGSYEAGINVRLIKIGNFVAMGVIGGFAGILDDNRISTADPMGGGTTLLLAAIAAGVIGGTALLGGVGTIFGAFFGAVALEGLQDGFTLQGVSSFTFDVILGIAILVSMTVNVRLTSSSGLRVAAAKLLRRRTG